MHIFCRIPEFKHAYETSGNWLDTKEILTSQKGVAWFVEGGVPPAMGIACTW